MNIDFSLKNPHLEGDAFLWPGNSTGVLLIHGFTATTAEVRPLAKKLQPAGYTISGPLLPGHGTSPADLRKCTWQQWVEGAETAYLDLKSRCEHVFVGGESMGGLLTLQLAKKYPEISGLLLFAPAMRVKGIWQTRFLAPFVPYRAKRPGDDGLPWKGYKINPVASLAELHKLQGVARQNLNQIHQPALIVQGKLDQTVELSGAVDLFENIGSADKQLFWMEKSGHCVIIDHELRKVADLVQTFLAKHNPTSKS